MRKMVLALLLALFAVSGLEAQGFLAFTRGPVTQEQYAAAIERNDRSVINLDCTSLVQSHNAVMARVGSQLRVQNCTQLASYIRSLTVVECPQGITAGLGRVSRSGRVDISDWRRPFASGEQCLYDNNEALFVASLSCGNFVTQRLSVRTAMVTPTPAPAPTPVGPQRIIVESWPPLDVRVEQPQIQIQERRRRSWVSRNWPWLTLATAAVGGGVYCGVISENNCGMTQEVVIIHN